MTTSTTTKKRLMVQVEVQSNDSNRCGVTCPMLTCARPMWGPQTAYCLAVREELGIITPRNTQDSGVVQHHICKSEAVDPGE